MRNRATIEPIVMTATLLIALSSGLARADITIEERMRVEGDGLMKMMNMTGTTVTTIAGDRARNESDIQMESRLMRTFGGVGQSVEIIRLDQGRMIELDPKKRTYREVTFAEMRAEMEKAMGQMREAQQSQQQGASGIDQANCDWSEPTSRREQTGETEQIAGHRAERVKFIATQSCTDRQTGQVCDFRLTLDQWFAPGLAASAEAQRFHRAYAEQLGLDAAGGRDFAERAESMFSGYGSIWGELAKNMMEADGYPVRSGISLAIGGPQCKSMQDVQAAGRAATPGVGEVLGGALGGALGGMLGRKRDTAAAQPAAEPAADAATALPADGMLRLMSISTELVSMREGPADPAAFEIPAGYKPAR